MKIMDELKKTDDFEKLEQVGLKLSSRLYNFKCKSIPTPKIALGEDEKVQ